MSDQNQPKSRLTSHPFPFPLPHEKQLHPDIDDLIKYIFRFAFNNDPADKKIQLGKLIDVIHHTETIFENKGIYNDSISLIVDEKTDRIIDPTLNLLYILLRVAELVTVDESFINLSEEREISMTFSKDTAMFADDAIKPTNRVVKEVSPMENVSLDQIYKAKYNGWSLDEAFRIVACFNPTQAVILYDPVLGFSSEPAFKIRLGVSSGFSNHHYWIEPINLLETLLTWPEFQGPLEKLRPAIVSSAQLFLMKVEDALESIVKTSKHEYDTVSREYNSIKDKVYRAQAENINYVEDGSTRGKLLKLQTQLKAYDKAFENAKILEDSLKPIKDKYEDLLYPCERLIKKFYPDLASIEQERHVQAETQPADQPQEKQTVTELPCAKAILGLAYKLIDDESLEVHLPEADSAASEVEIHHRLDGQLYIEKLEKITGALALLLNHSADAEVRRKAGVYADALMARINQKVFKERMDLCIRKENLVMSSVALENAAAQKTKNVSELEQKIAEMKAFAEKERSSLQATEENLKTTSRELSQNEARTKVLHSLTQAVEQYTAKFSI